MIIIILFASHYNFNYILAPLKFLQLQSTTHRPSVLDASPPGKVLLERRDLGSAQLSVPVHCPVDGHGAADLLPCAILWVQPQLQPLAARRVGKWLVGRTMRRMHALRRVQINSCLRILYC